MTAADPLVPGQSVTLTGTVMEVLKDGVMVSLYPVVLTEDIVREDGDEVQFIVPLSAVSSAPDDDKMRAENERLRAALDRIIDPSAWLIKLASGRAKCWWCGLIADHSIACPVIIATEVRKEASS